MAGSLSEELSSKLASRTAVVAICGLGYVGLPLAAAAGRAGYSVLGFDTDATKIDRLNAGRSYIDAVSAEDLAALVADRRFRATNAFAELSAADVVVICVPTPLTPQREPDLSYVSETGRTVAKHMRPGQLVVLESTSYPGTTDGLLKPILESTGYRSRVDFFLGFSPEREDPGNPQFATTTIPKIVSGDGARALRLVEQFYAAVVETVVPVSSTETAEAVKITENVFRAVNIALVNELKVVFSAMGIDVWEVIEAAKTKPFGFMPFYPGPGLGGHCIPIDPFYLAWKSREFDQPTRFIELAGEINRAMPHYVVGRLAEELDGRFGRSLNGSRVLIVGLAYKRDVGDVRESPSLKLTELLEARNVQVDFYDPRVSEIPLTREHPEFAGRKSVDITTAALEAYDAVLIVTDHTGVDYAAIVHRSKLVVDTRNVCARSGIHLPNIVKA